MNRSSQIALGCLALIGVIWLIAWAAAFHAWSWAWLIVLTVALFSVWLIARGAVRRAEQAERTLEQERGLRTHAIAALAKRVEELENVTRPGAPAPTPATEGTAAEVPIEVAPLPMVSALEAAAPAPPPAPEVAAIPETPPPVPPPVPEAPRPAWREGVRKALDLEQVLGVNWLSKLGVAVLVLGIGFFLAWQLREVGPAGKITVGFLVSAALLGAGVWGERRESIRILARAALAGGWALLFFVAYAAHHVPATRVIESEFVDLVLMLAVVAAMVVHTLRYRSQVVTGLAFTLAFTTVAINRVDVYSLAANVILAIGFAYVVVRMRWFALEIIGILAIYLNHYIWLTPIIEPMRGHVHPFSQFYASATILLLYWAVFRVSYVVRPPDDEKTSAVAGVLNSVLLLGVMKYQSAHPELAFWALLALGSIEIALGRLPMVRRKRTTFVVLTTIGSALVVAAIPFRYAPSYVSPIWLVEAELLFIVGVLTGERVYRRLGMIAAGATALQILAVPVARLVGWRLGGALPVTHEWVLGSICIAAMIALYADAVWAPRRWPDPLTNRIDADLTRVVSYAAAILGVAGGWAMFPASGAAVFWIALALLIAAAGQRFAVSDLTIQANLLAIAAVIRVLVVNLPSNEIAAGPLRLTVRILTVSAVAAMIYLLSRWNRSDTIAISRSWPAAATWCGSALVSLLAWYELRPISVAPAWTILGVVLLELGLMRSSRNLRIQAWVALIAAFTRTFTVNMNSETGGWTGPRVVTVVPVALALLYAWYRLETCESAPPDRGTRPRRIFAWLSLLCVTALLRFELSSDVVAVAWAALTVGLVAVAVFSGRRVFLHMGIAVAFAALFRGVMHNLYERSYFPPPGKIDTWLLVGSIVVLLAASLPFAFRLRQTEGAPRFNVFTWFDRRPEQILFFIPLALLTILLATEMRKGFLTVAWGVEAVIVFVIALLVKERSYRLAGLALLLLCVGKIFVFDFWTLTLRDKALTGIVLGAALIGVSVLYTRKRDAILQFL